MERLDAPIHQIDLDLHVLPRVGDAVTVSEAALPVIYPVPRKHRAGPARSQPGDAPLGVVDANMFFEEPPDPGRSGVETNPVPVPLLRILGGRGEDHGMLRTALDAQLPIDIQFTSRGIVSAPFPVHGGKPDLRTGANGERSPLTHGNIPDDLDLSPPRHRTGDAPRPLGEFEIGDHIRAPAPDVPHRDPCAGTMEAASPGLAGRVGMEGERRIRLPVEDIRRIA